MPPATVNVLFFARARELAETSTTHLTLDAETSSPTVADARARLETDFPALTTVLHTAVFALNRAYVHRDAERDTALRDGDDLAVVPPISGG